MPHQDKSVPACNPQSKKQRVRARGMEREKAMLTAFKTHGNHVLLHPISTTIGLRYLSAVVCVSVRLQASQSGSVTLCCFSSWLLLFSIPPSVPLLLCLLSYIFTPPPFFIPLTSFSSFIFFRVCLFLTRVELPTVGLILLLPTTSSFHPTLLLLIGTEGG